MPFQFLKILEFMTHYIGGLFFMVADMLPQPKALLPPFLESISLNFYIISLAFSNMPWYLLLPLRCWCEGFCGLLRALPIARLWVPVTDHWNHRETRKTSPGLQAWKYPCVGEFG